MEDKPLPAPDEGPTIADAEALFREAPASKAPSVPSGATGRASGEEYDVESAEVPDAPRSSAAPIAAPRSKKPAAPKAPPRPARDPSEAVTEVWSRQAEWGQTLLIVGGTTLGVAFLLFILLSFGQFGLAFLVLLAGGASLVILSYPILITLERPVRITPEQAVRDYFSALSHHVPHLRRMWLLLSDDGRLSGSFGSFEGFQAYWKERLEKLRADRASGFTPLKFKIEDFRAEKSAGRSEVEASFTVTVAVRGRSDDGPIETHRVATTLVKGPDNMWYLDRGTLP